MTTAGSYKPSQLNPYILVRSDALLKCEQRKPPTLSINLNILPPPPPLPLPPQPITQVQPPKVQARQSPKRRYPKDDYQKNITINVVKCCIRELLGRRYRRLLKRLCQKKGISLEDLMNFAEPILKEVVISLGDLKDLLTEGEKESKERGIRDVFRRFLQWYLRHRYMNYLLAEGKMNSKERYIEFKNKYIL